MSFTKQEKRLFIREVAKGCWCGGGDFTAKEAIASAVHLADELEAFERKQDEEEDKMRYCFGIGIKEESPTSEKDCVCRQYDCGSCLVVQQCQEKRGSK